MVAASCLVIAADWGTVAEWVSGIGSFLAAVAAVAAAVIALRVSNRAQNDAREARRAISRDRAANLLVRLISAVERDIRAAEETGHPTAVVRSPEGAALCRALWGRRNQFGTVWHMYCEEDQRWIQDLRGNGQLFPQLREELQRALDSLDHEDRAA